MLYVVPLGTYFVFWAYISQLPLVGTDDIENPTWKGNVSPPGVIELAISPTSDHLSYSTVVTVVTTVIVFS